MINAARRTFARPGGGASRLGRWRRSDALRIGFLAATVALAGCAGPGGLGTPAPVETTGTAPAATPAGAGAAVAANPAAPFAAGVGLTRPGPLRLGDAIGFVLTTTAAGYGHVYLLNASGAVVALGGNVPVAPDAPALFPAPDAGFVLRASPPAGSNRVVLLVTAQPFAGLGGPTAPGMAPVTLSMQADAFVAALNAATARLAPNGWTVAEARVEVVAGG